MGKDEPTQKVRKKGGCLGRLVALFTLAALAGLGVGVFFVLQPQDTSDIAGTGSAAVTQKARDLRVVLRNASEKGYELSLTEDEINRYLAQTLKASQTGPLAELASIRQVAVRLEDGRAEVVLTREVAGRPLTVSMYFRVEQLESPDGSVSTQIHLDGGGYHEELPRPLVGGRFGRVPVPQGFLVLVLPAFQQLAEVYRSPPDESGRLIPEKEIDFIEDMARIRIEKGKLVLDPVGARAMVPPAAR